MEGESRRRMVRGEGSIAFIVTCSICLEAVTGNEDRSKVKLRCGHEFHLDCIGSAFNAKGVMQCPNCRKVEKGEWLYANGYGSVPEVSMDDVSLEDDLHELSYSELPFDFHWCPFGGLARLIAFGEGELTTAASSHSSPYVPYFQPLQLPSSPSNYADRITEGPTVYHWGGLSGPNDITNSHAFPAVDLPYNSWDHHSPPFAPTSSRINGVDQPPVSSAMLRVSMSDSNGVPRTGASTHPLFLSHGSTYRADTPVIIPQFLGNSQSYAQAHAQGLQAYHQQPNLAAVHAPVLRSTGQRGSGIIGLAPSSDQLGTYLFPSGLSGRNLLDAENNAASLLYAWERERLAPYSLAPAGSDLTQWGPIHPIYGGSDSSSSLMELWHWL